MDRFIIAILSMLTLTYPRTNHACFAKGFEMDELLIRDLNRHFKQYNELEKNTNIQKNNTDILSEFQFIDLTPKIAFPESCKILQEWEIYKTSQISSRFLKQKFSTAQQELIRAEELYSGFLKLIKGFTKNNLKELIQKTKQEFRKNTREKIKHNPQKIFLKKVYTETELHLRTLDECINFYNIPKKEEFEDIEAMLTALLDINIFLQENWKPYYLLQIKKKL